MKKIVLLLLSIGMFTSFQAQKKELKKLSKYVKAYKWKEANKIFSELKETVKGTEYEAQYHYLKGKNLFGKGNKQNYTKAYPVFYKVLELERKNNQYDFSEDAIGYINIINRHYFKQVTNAVKNSNYNEAGKNYNKFYKLNPQRRDVLRLALFSYQKAENKQKMAETLELLLKKEKGNKIFTAKNDYTKRTDEFFTQSARDKAIKYKTHVDAKDETPEKLTRVEYYNMLVRIYDQQNKTKKTIGVLNRAKKEYPKNSKFYEDHAAVIYKTGNNEAYLKSLDDALTLNPNNKNLWFNYGVVSQGLNKVEKAVTAYDKAIEIDPNYRGAYINKGLTILSEEKNLIDELNNNLRNRKKYKEIDAKIKAMYLRAIPAFEKANELKADEGIKASLINLYNSVGQKDKAATLK